MRPTGCSRLVKVGERPLRAIVFLAYPLSLGREDSRAFRFISLAMTTLPRYYVPRETFSPLQGTMTILTVQKSIIKTGL